jgi:hypothetical protein
MLLECAQEARVPATAHKGGATRAVPIGGMTEPGRGAHSWPGRGRGHGMNNPELAMNRICFVAIGALLVIGCYREPTDPALATRDRIPPSRPSAGAIPDDTLPAGRGVRDAAAEEVIEDREVLIGSMSLTAPEGWIRRPPSSGFLITEFTLPKVEGDADNGRLTVSTAGGSVEANIDRWKDQFGGNPDPASQETWEVGGVSVTVVDFSGTYNDQPGPFAPATPKPGYRMLAAIIPLDGDLFFLKGYGPQKTIEAHAGGVSRTRLFTQIE